MPKTLTDEKTISAIVTYIETNALEEPEWFQEEFKKNGGGSLR
jgi:hypothetical protein